MLLIAYKQRIVAVTVGLLLACCPGAFALDPALDVDQYAHTVWKVRDGFTRGSIISIAQTSDGYIWLGTEFGLLRFDGVKTVPWQPPVNQPVPSAPIYSLLAARDGTLWIGAADGLASWKDGRLTQYEKLAGRQIFTLLEDGEGTVWATGNAVTIGKLCAIRAGNVQCYGEDGSLGRGAFNLYEDSKGNLWAGVKNGLWRWGPGVPKFYPLAGEPDGIQALAEDADGTLLFGWEGGLQRFVDGKVGPYPMPGITRHFEARRILRDHDGGLWIGTTSQGLVHVHQGRTDVFTQSDGLSGNGVLSLFEDRESNIWVATMNGIDRFRELAVATFTMKDGLTNSNVFSVLADRDRSVWLSTFGGLDRWNNGRIASYDKRGGKLNGLVPYSLFQDDRGRVWVSTIRQFGYVENDRFNAVSGVPGGAVLSIAQDRAGNLWLANEHLGLFRLSPQSEVRQVPWTELGHKDHASSLAADPSQGGLWIGFFLGGIAYFEDGRIRASYTTKDGLGEGRIGGFKFDRDGVLWVATENGLSRLKNGHIATLTSRNGLPCDTDKVHWLIEDDDHSFWLYMTCGLVRIARAEMDAWAAAVDRNAVDQNAVDRNTVDQNKDAKRMIQATVFDSFDGVRILAFSGHFDPQVTKTLDGRLWFTPMDGVSIIDPHHLSFNKLPPPVHVEKIIADRRTYDTTFAADGKMRLPPLVRDLQIDYTALSYAAPEKVLFRYKLEGFDQDWQQAGTRRQAIYNTLPPGSYRFRVAACNNSGVWNEDGATLDFAIAPAWYQTASFRALCVVSFLALLWSLSHFRRRQLQRHFDMRLEARVNERTRIARELHDTLLQSFHGLMFEFQAARNMFARSPEKAMQALDGAILGTEEAIAESRNAIQDLRSEPVAHGDLAEALTSTSQELADAYDADHNPPAFRMVVEGERQGLSPAFQDEVCRIAREVLRNAFRHAQANRIETEIRYDVHEFRLRIRDDGKGVDPKILAQGGAAGHWGLSGIRERAQQIGAQLNLWSEAGAGTEVQLTVPAAVAYRTSRERSGFKLFRKSPKP